MQELPVYISIVFILSTTLTIWLFYKAFRHSSRLLFFMFGWIVFQSLLGLSGFYIETQSMPPRFILLLVPPLITIAILFLTVKGRRVVDSMNLRYLTLLHVVRIPVEIVLFWLFIYGTVPQLMTFEGRNWDIFSGITAPIVYLALIKGRTNPTVMLIWNYMCLGLLLNIMANGILSAATPFQQFGFEQPNIAITYFPFILLPGFIVPVVLFCHLASVRLLLSLKYTQATA